MFRKILNLLKPKNIKKESKSKSDLTQNDINKIIYFMLDTTQNINGKPLNVMIYTEALNLVERKFGWHSKNSFEDPDKFFNYLNFCNTTQEFNFMIETFMNLILESNAHPMLKIFAENNTERKNFLPKISKNDAPKNINEILTDIKWDYRYDKFINRVIEVKNPQIHEKIMEETVRILQVENFYGADDELRKAIDQHAKGEYEEAITSAAKAFESTLITICDAKGWVYKANCNAKTLINICLSNNLIPQYLQSQFNNFQPLLESGATTIRNKNAAHGQGSQIRHVEKHLSEYCMHLSASNILFLIELYKNM